MAKQVLHKHFKDIEVSTLGFGGTRWAMEEGNNERIDRKGLCPDRCGIGAGHQLF